MRAQLDAMRTRTTSGPMTTLAAATRRGEQAQDWQTRAVAEYARTADELSAELPQRLIRRLLALTGTALPKTAVTVDAAVWRATAIVDGAVFLLRRNDLAVVRPCAYCGTGRFESASIVSRGDLGYALVAWTPYHRDCEPTDPADDVSW